MTTRGLAAGLGGVCLLAVLLVSPARPTDAKPKRKGKGKTVALKTTKTAYTLRALHLSANETLPTSRAVRVGKLGGRALLFVDVDGNGSFGDVDVDGWARLKPVERKRRKDKQANTRFVYLLRSTVVLGGESLAWRVSADGTKVAYTATPIKAPSVILAGLAKLNELRMQNGLSPVGYDEAVAKKARLHVHYMTTNDAYGHAEVAGKSGFTKEGAWAGIHSVIDSGVTLEEAVERWWASLYHRRPLSTARLRSVGAATSDRFAMMVPNSPNEESGIDWPTLVPAPDSRGASTHGGREKPLPFPDGEKPGYPITLEFPGFNDRVTDVTATVRSVDKKGRTQGVEVYLSTLEKPAHTSRPGNDGCICMFPVLPLDANTTYRVHVQYTWRGNAAERRWSFRTGAERKPPGKYAR